MPRGDTFPQKPLAIGFAAILGVISLNSVIGLVESVRSDEAADRSVRESERSMYLIGQIRQDLRRMLVTNDDVRTIDADLEANLNQLNALLSDAERARWVELLRIIEAIRRDPAAVPSGQLQRFFLDYEEFIRFNFAETERTLGRADRELAFARTVQIALATGTLAAIAAIWILVARTFHRQQRLLHGYLERIETSNRDLEAFAGRVAHDLKNVLSPVIMAGQLLKVKASDPASVNELGQRLERGTRRAVALLDALLAFSRAEQTPADGESASLDEALHGVVEELAPLRDRLAATLTIEANPGLRVRCSPGLLHVVLINVISNALKFLDGRPTREVRVVARSDGDGCSIEVDDTGPGIPREAIDRIFEPFFRVPGVRVEGTGIGLATVRRVIDAHQGRITVESTEGQGTRVRIWLKSS